MFLPTTKQEMKALGWSALDVILISGDTYFDTYYDGVSLIGRVLFDAGYKVGIIAQPDVDSDIDITRLGEPLLFWGISSGCVDSMVANYTALKKRKRNDDMTPGGLNNKRPDRAIIVYTNIIRKYFKNTKPIIIGGVESSLRRIAHYDYWSDSVRRSIIFDSKADILVHGMGERTVLELAHKLKNGIDYKDNRGICYIAKETNPDFIQLPDYETVKTDKLKFMEMFDIFYKNNDPLNAKGLAQKHGDRYLIQNPPNFNPTPIEMDKIYEFDFQRDIHPYYASAGKIKAADTIQFSVNSHRGCFGECNFCAITVHQGRTVSSRSEESIIREVMKMTKHKSFKGIISDVGGPTADMYGMTCPIQSTRGSCKNKRCIFPDVCRKMDINHSRQLDLLERLRQLPGVRKIFLGSGIRYDLVIADDEAGKRFLVDVIENHVSGQMKIAPEHTEPKVLRLMGKASEKYLMRFKDDFDRITRELGKKQFLTYYFIAAHPGCEPENMNSLKKYINTKLKLNPEQVQIFTPTPSTYSTAMYYTGLDFETKDNVFVELELKKKDLQKQVIIPPVQKNDSNFNRNRR